MGERGSDQPHENRVCALLRSRTIEQSFDPRSNSLNALRLVFALLVIVSHSITLGGFGSEAIVGNATLGDISVDGFFGISGFLVARSAMTSTSMGRYSWHRFLRIFPGIWVCFLFIALVMGPLAFIHQNPDVSVSHYFTSPNGPVSFMASNFSVTQLFAFNTHTVLIAPASAISGTPAGVPLPGSWAGALWTVQWELLCYVLLAVFALFGVLRHRTLVLAFFLVTWGLAWANYRTTDSVFHGSFNWIETMRLVPIFFLGSLIYLYRNAVPDSPVLAVVSAGLFIYGLYLPYGSFDVLFGPALIYLVIWLGIHLPLSRFGKKNDLSFGVYIYGWSVAELLAVWGVNKWGYVPYTGLTIGLALCLAALSWKLVESRAMRLKGWTPTLRRPAMPDLAPGAVVPGVLEPAQVVDAIVD
jgi:peptidoglycan/LPS O-acetylase OafA/YrhL